MKAEKALHLSTDKVRVSSPPHSAKADVLKSSQSSRRSSNGGIFIHLYMYKCLVYIQYYHVFMSVNAYTCMHVCMYDVLKSSQSSRRSSNGGIYVYIFISTYTIYVYLFMSIYAYTCMNICMYAYIHVY
jgi:hypothetical protein